MASYRLRALALKKTKLGETDLIVTLLAADGCQVRAVAKGARKPGSRFGARVEPFVVADLLLSRGRSLDVITDAEIVSGHGAIRTDYDRAQAASVVADVLDKISVECQIDDRLFGLAEATLDAMESAGGDTLLVLVTAFLVKAMAMHGYRPQFDACASCGAPVGGAVSTYSLEVGGPLCEGCEAPARECAHASAAVRSALASLMRATMAEAATLQVDRRVLVDAFALMRAFVRYHVHARLKALDLYATDVCRPGA